MQPYQISHYWHTASLISWRKSGQKQNGFTLIEMLMSLVLLGIMGALAGLGLTQYTEGIVFATANAATAGKSQLAMQRLTKEFTAIKSVTSGAASAITFTSQHGSGVDRNYTLSVQGSANLVLHDNASGAPATEDILTDQVSSFSLAYYDAYNSAPAVTWSGTSRIIEVTLSLAGASNNTVTFTTRVTPRNL